LPLSAGRSGSNSPNHFASGIEQASALLREAIPDKAEHCVAGLVSSTMVLQETHSLSLGTGTTPSLFAASCIVDDEEWLLSTIQNRPADEVRSCPATFAQAMGEKEYESPIASLAGKSRTQLWKPSRSWWEAKSGKNPWIEPSLHNKRWR
jgi:hypothetical protein